MTNEEGVDAAGSMGVSAGQSSASGPLAAVPVVLAGGIAYGTLEVLLDSGVQGVRAHLQAALLAGIPALLLGVLAAGAVAALRRRHFILRLTEWLQKATSRNPSSDRDPVIRWHAVAITGVATLAAWAMLAGPLFTALFAMQEEGLAIVLAVGISTAMVAGGAVAQWVAVPLWRRPLGWVDRRWALPLPPWAAVRYLLFIAMPSVALLMAFSRKHGDLLGDVGRWIAVPLVLVTAGLVAHVWRVVRPASARRRTGLGISMLVGWSLATTLATRDRAYGVGDRSTSPAAALGASLARGIIRDTPTASANAEALASTAMTDAPEATANAFAGPRDGKPERYNIVWIIVDALRADKVGASQGGRPLTPNLDKLARDSVVFTRAYAQGSATSYSIPSMLTGRNVDSIVWGWANNRPQLPESELTVAERLKDHGYQTSFVMSQFIHGALSGMLQGYDSAPTAAGSKDTRRLWGPRTSPLATAKALAMLNNFAPGVRARKPFFLTVYYGEPHAPYVNHEELGKRFPSTLEGRYEADIAFMDLHLGQLLELLKIRKPLWKDTILIFTADHGEEFGEHGHQRHGHTCHVEAVNVPLLVRIPGVEPAKIDTPVALVDIVPTLIELVGAPRRGALSGQSLLVPIHASDRVDRERPIFSGAAHQRGDQTPFLVRAVRQGDYALFHNRRGDSWALFDTARDPGEHTDIAAEPAHAERLHRMRELLTSNLTGNLGTPPARSEAAAEPLESD